MNILIPMAGNGQRFVDAGFTEPKPFIDVEGKPMIERVIENLGGLEAGHYIFVVRSYTAMHRVRAIVPEATVVITRDPTAGAACTALLAREFIDDDEPLLIANSDQIIREYHTDEPPKVEMPDKDALVDGIVWTFDAQHPKWSYAVTDNRERIWAVVEKQIVSRRATCGIYWWKHGKDFVHAAQKMIDKNVRVNNEFYIAPVYNEAIMQGATVVEAPVETMWSLGTPEDYYAYLTRPRS